MNEEKEDPILAAPNVVKEESTPMETNENEIVSSDDKDKNQLNYDERRISLLNNPTYGVILGFLDKFRTFIDIQDYPLHLLEENLLSDQENISRRLIDFHLTLLKRISLGKGAQRDKFVPIITKFAYRFDYDDGEYLKTNGYSQAQIDIKLRILKNLLETQFDHNQGFKTALLEKQSFEVRSQSFGRDRSGASYWLFMDSECFIRLFRENIDEDRSWTNVAKDKDELENMIKMLITDNTVRKKFPDWKHTHESFNSLEPSNEFEQRYMPTSFTVKKEEVEEAKPKLPPPAARTKTQKNVNTNRKKPLPPPVVKNEIPSDQESSHSVEKNGERSRIVSSEDTNPNALPQEINNNQEDKQLKRPSKKSRGRRKSTNWNKKKRRTASNTSKKDDNIQEVKTPTKGRKRKQVIDNEDEIQDTKKNDETSHNKDTNQLPMDDQSNNNDDLPIALRRSRRTHKAATNEPPSVTSSPAKSVSQTPTKKKLTNGKCKPASQTNVKVSSQSSKSNGRHKHRRRRRGGKKSMNGVSSSSDDEHQPSEEEDEYNSDDYLPDNKQVDELNEEDLLEEEDDEYVPRRSAKTVAKRHGQMIENNNEDLQSSSSACCVCSKTDRPESLLLCDDCDDAYHLECLKPILLSVPDGDWYCPLCEHKRLCDNLIEKFIQLLKEHAELEVKRNQCMSKRTNRLANVMFNLDRMVKRSTKKRRTNGIVYSDEENEDDEEEAADENNKSEEEEDEEDDDSVYGFKDDGSIDGGDKSKRSSTSPSRGRRGEHEPERLGVRSCRRKPQNYRFDDYDKKMKEAMIDAGANGDEIDKDSDESEDEIKKKSLKKSGGYHKDEDFDTSAVKNDDEFAPDQHRSDESGSEEEEDYDDDDESSDDDGWKNKRRSSPKKKSGSKSHRRKSKNKSDDDDDDESLSDTELSNFQTADTTKSENNDYDLDDIDNEDRRRSSRTTTQRNYAKQQEGDTDEDEEDLYEDGRPPPRRMRYKKRRGSDESFIDDDDYDKLARKRKIVKYEKSISRSSISDHLKKLVDEDDEAPEDKQSAVPSQDDMEQDVDDIPKEQKKIPADEPQQSDDDDFPDEQEIFKANGLLKLQKNLSGPKPAGFRPPFAAPTHSYQHAIIDPTARFAMIRPPVRPANNGYPSNGYNPNLGENQQPSDDLNQVNGHNSPSS